jgi:hypothetical protein
LRAAGHRGAIAARLADDRRRFTGNRRFVDRGHAFDHFAVRRNDVAGFDQHDVADFERGRRHQPIALRIARTGHELGLSLGALPPQRLGLRLAAAFGDGFGEVGEQHGEPQPQNDLKLEADMLAAGDEIADQNHRGQRRDDLEHEHHRILHQRPRIELDEGGADRRHDDLGIEQRRYRHALAQM